MNASQSTSKDTGPLRAFIETFALVYYVPAGVLYQSFAVLPDAFPMSLDTIKVEQEFTSKDSAIPTPTSSPATFSILRSSNGQSHKVERECNTLPAHPAERAQKTVQRRFFPAVKNSYATVYKCAADPTMVKRGTPRVQKAIERRHHLSKGAQISASLSDMDMVE
ncbi:hypothetical protein BDQ17DRAFT_1428095 [Cyathus striatus]|nr:hypothetical protein BDQ17DRAFT_1428095 [Cyathus striatus]